MRHPVDFPSNEDDDAREPSPTFHIFKKELLEVRTIVGHDCGTAAGCKFQSLSIALAKHVAFQRSCGLDVPSTEEGCKKDVDVLIEIESYHSIAPGLYSSR